MAAAKRDILIHFETRADKPRVFKMTEPLISDALARSGVQVGFSLGQDIGDLSLLQGATGLVTSNDVICDRRFPRHRLPEIAPKLRWIHIIGAGIEPLFPFGHGLSYANFGYAKGQLYTLRMTPPGHGGATCPGDAGWSSPNPPQARGYVNLGQGNSSNHKNGYPLGSRPKACWTVRADAL